MTHDLRISVSKKPQSGGTVNVRNVTVRERILRFLLGPPRKLTIIVPGNTVETLSINEVPEGGAAHEPD